MIESCGVVLERAQLLATRCFSLLLADIHACTGECSVRPWLPAMRLLELAVIIGILISYFPH